MGLYLLLKLCVLFKILSCLQVSSFWLLFEDVDILDFWKLLGVSSFPFHGFLVCTWMNFASWLTMLIDNLIAIILLFSTCLIINNFILCRSVGSLQCLASDILIIMGSRIDIAEQSGENLLRSVAAPVLSRYSPFLDSQLLMASFQIIRYFLIRQLQILF